VRPCGAAPATAFGPASCQAREGRAREGGPIASRGNPLGRTKPKRATAHWRPKPPPESDGFPRRVRPCSRVAPCWFRVLLSLYLVFRLRTRGLGHPTFGWAVRRLCAFGCTVVEHVAFGRFVHALLGRLRTADLDGPSGPLRRVRHLRVPDGRKRFCGMSRCFVPSGAKRTTADLRVRSERSLPSGRHRVGVPFIGSTSVRGTGPVAASFGVRLVSPQQREFAEFERSGNARRARCVERRTAPWKGKALKGATPWAPPARNKAGRARGGVQGAKR
jgi:hypothetical protein